MLNKSSKIVSLSVHKNTLDKKNKRKIANSLEQSIKNINYDKQITGYVLVGWTNKISERVYYDFNTKDTDCFLSIPERVKQALVKEFHRLDIEE